MDPQIETPNPILNHALKMGAVTGAVGILAGGAYAILRGSPTVGLFSVLTGVNCGILGSSYWATRLALLQALQDPGTPWLQPREKAYISGASGATAGSFVALVTGKPRSIIPGAIVWGLGGLASQSAYNFADARHTQSVTEKQERKGTGKLSFWDRAMRSKWSPVTKLTTEEYEKMLRERLLVLEADLALANEEVEKLEKIQREQAMKNKKP